MSRTLFLFLYVPACVGVPDSDERNWSELEPGPVCGARVDELLTKVAEQVKSTFANSLDADLALTCEQIPTYFGWDISNLLFAEKYLTTEVDGAPEGTCGYETAAGTVTVGGECWFAGEVNYFLYGLASKLCWDSGHGIWLSRELIRAWRTNVDFCSHTRDLRVCRPPETAEDWDRHEQGVRGRETWYDIGESAAFGPWKAAASPERYAGFVPCSAQLDARVTWHLGRIVRNFDSPVEP